MRTNKLAAIAGAITIGLTTAALPQRAAAAGGHEKVFGVTAGWTSRNESATAGLFFQYRFSEHFRLEPSACIAFRKDNRDALMIDVNAHVPFRTSGRVELYPLAGVNYSAWSYHLSGEAADDSDDVTNRVSRLGLNAGGGVGLYVSSTLKLTLEAKYTLLKGHSNARVSVGIGYVF